MKPTSRSSAALVVLCAVITACGDTATSAPSTTTAPPAATTSSSATTTSTAAPTTTATGPASTTTAAEELVPYRNGEYGFTIRFPRDWDVHENVGDVAVLFTAPGYPDALSVHVFIDDSRSDWTLPAFVDHRKSEIQSATGVSSESEWLADEGETALGSNQATYLEYAGTLHPDEISVFFLEVISVDAGRGFIVTLASPGVPPAFPTFGDMVRSFDTSSGA